MMRIAARLIGVQFKIILLISATVSASFGLRAQDFDWVMDLGTGTSMLGITTDQNGHIYLHGTYSGNVVIGSNNFTSQGSADLCMIKCDSLGNVIWAKSIGGINPDYWGGLSVDNDGSIYVTGTFEDSAYFESTLLISTGEKDVFIAKYDNLGALVWVKSAGGTSWDFGRDVTTDGSGYLYISGNYRNTAYFDSDSLVTAGGEDVYVAKYDTSGQEIWARTGGAGGWDQNYAICLDNTGMIYATGFVNSGASFGSFNLSVAGSVDAYIVKYNSNGDVVWAKVYGAFGFDVGKAIEVDDNFNLRFLGTKHGILNFDSVNIPSHGDQDGFLMKLDSSGFGLWGQTLGGTGVDDTRGVSIDQFGTSYSVGYFELTGTFGNSQSLSTGGNDGFVVAHDDNGALLWYNTIESSVNDGAFGAALGTNGLPLICGFHGANATLGSLSSSVASGFIAKLKPSFALLQIEPILQDSFCAGDSVGVTLTAAGDYMAGNSFSVELSDQFGDFNNAVIIGSVIGLSSVNVPCMIPDTMASSGNYRFKVVASNPVISSTDNGVDIAIITTTYFSLVLSGDSVICEGDSVTLTAPSIFTDYLWSTGDTVNEISPKLDDSYSVSAQTSLGCNAYSDTVYLPVFDSTIFINDGINLHLCHESFEVLSAGGVYSSYGWTSGELTQSISVSDSGRYSVAVTNSTGCVARSNTIEVDKRFCINYTDEYKIGSATAFNAVDTISDGIIVASTIEDSGGKKQVGLMKTDFLGNTIWSKVYSTNRSCRSSTVMVTSSGKIVVAGSVSVEFGPGIFGSYIFVMQTNEDGDLIWANTYGNGYSNIAHSIRELADNTYIIAGKVRIGTWSEAYMLRVDTNGTLIWDKAYDYTNGVAYDVQVAPDGLLIVAGQQSSDGYLLFKIDPSGNMVWDKSAHKNPSVLGPLIGGVRTFQILPDSSYILVGHGHEYPSGTVKPSMLVKLDKNGDKEWVRFYGFKEDSYAYDVKAVSDGYIVAATHDYTSSGVPDGAVIFKTDLEGNLIWNQFYEGSVINSSFSKDKMDMLLMESGILYVATDENQDYGVVGKINYAGDNNCYSSYTLTEISDSGHMLTNTPPTLSSLGVMDTITVLEDSIPFIKTQYCFECDTPIVGFSYVFTWNVLTFTNTSYNIDQVYWDFGDGNTSSALNPSHAYTASGVYNICLTISSPCGTASTCNSVNVVCPTITAQFSYSDSSLTVDFADNSTNATMWSWDFGDGDSSTTQNPVHSYADSGTYQVCLIASSICAADTICMSISLILAPPPPGIEDNLLSSDIAIYPNPNRGEFTVLINRTGKGDIDMSIANILGQEVYYNRLLSSGTQVEEQLNLTALPSGIYVLSLRSEKWVVNRQLIIE